MLKAIRRALGALSILAITLGAYLYFHATHQQAYATARNLRILASLSTQIGAKFQTADTLLNSADVILKLDKGDEALPFIPAYQHFALRLPSDMAGRKGGPGFTAANAAMCVESRQARVDNVEWLHDRRAPPSCLYRTFEISPAKKGTSSPPSGVAFLNAATYLERDFHPRVFDKVVIADDSGQVILQAGSPDISLTRLDATVESGRPDSAAGWSTLKLKSNIVDVNLAGKTYRVFLEPCCRLPDGSYWPRPLILAGLVNRDQFVRASLKISLSLLTLCSAVLILIVLAWPFLKFRLMGERQPVGLGDGLFLGLASFLAAALVSIFLLDLYSYNKYRAIRDRELSQLSAEIATSFGKEVTAARRALVDLYRRAAVRGETANGADRNQIRKDSSGFAFFESWSLLDSTGWQKRKWSTDAFVQPLIPVPDRAYFRTIKAGQGWVAPLPVTTSPPNSISAAEDSFFLESTVSRTTGKRQAAVAIPTGDPAAPVATMALEMLSLIGVVLPPAYSFAVLDDSGKVLFHADPSRNLDERFFSEADENRRLRSAVVARTVDTLNLRYGGFDYRAHIAPLSGLPWTLVTLLEKEPGRITNAESLVSSVFLVLVYTLILVVTGILVLVFRPGYRVPWLWPDRRLYRGYLRIAVINGFLLAAFLVAFMTLDRDDLLATGFLLPLAGIAAGWAGLPQKRDRARAGMTPRLAVLVLSMLLGSVLLGSAAAGWPHLLVFAVSTAGLLLSVLPAPKPKPTATSITRVYLSAATLFILLIGAMPAASFFKVTRKAHTEMLVKGSQLHLAKRLEHRADSLRQTYSDALGQGKTNARKDRLCVRTRGTDLCELDLYYRFFFQTRMMPDSQAAIASSPRPASARLVGGVLAPYRPGVSVEWRGLHPSGSQDGAWSWATAQNRLQFRGSTSPGRPSITLSSVVPGFRPASLDEAATGALLAGVLLVLVWGIANFVSRRFFLLDVTDPVIVSRRRRIVSLGGTNLFVVCLDATEEKSVRLGGEAKPFDLRRNLRNGGDLRWLVGKVGEGDLVLLRHFEYRHEDEAITKAKLNLLDTLVHEYNCNVVVLSGQHSDGSPLGLRAAWRLASATGQTQGGPAKALESLVVVDAGRWLDGAGKKERRCSGRKTAAVASTLGSIVADEGRCDRHLRSIWHGLQESMEQSTLHHAEPGREELLDVMGERAESYYRELWESCRPPERSVLVHLASSGLVNEKDRRILRRLLARGLIRREPNFVVMNETFRRYLLGHAAEVEAQVPVQPSTWDTVRQPILVLGAALVIVLFVTQQELFGATTAVVAALASGVASVSKISGLFDKRSPGGIST